MLGSLFGDGVLLCCAYVMWDLTSSSLSLWSARVTAMCHMPGTVVGGLVLVLVIFLKKPLVNKLLGVGGRRLCFYVFV